MMSENSINEAIQKAAQKIVEAKAIVITAGAGMGVDSGLHIYRTQNDFLDSHPVARELNLSLPDLSNVNLFQTNPHLAWGFYGQRWQMYRKALPHAGYQIALEFCISKRKRKGKGDQYFVFTSNVDGHFLSAGFNPSRVVEAHGTIACMQCLDISKSKEVWAVPSKTKIKVNKQTMLAQDPLPMGPPGSEHPTLARPALRFYNDKDWIDDPFKKKEEEMEAFVSKIKSKMQPFVVLEIGAGDRDPRIRVRSLGESLAKENDLCTLIRINTNSEDVAVPNPEKNIAIQLPALLALVRLEAKLKTSSLLNAN
ncbi:hypothetical protein TCAL_15426 [Tigriopus californicus]|uniref:Deacetylase sirtuin-type domain-containing protein n=1 Tax=Tigriopus californicus TaxID=6832 RepID=A0A553PTY7_TIGCA|nr:uncharacterized protein LOC131891860 [Tigriopus californicus]TRY81139.1 hypothetical protein TCAL_15426 [Tigriopus californicus]